MRLFLCLAVAALTASPASAAPGALEWIAGRWSHEEGCANWVQFAKAGTAWVYSEQRFQNAEPQPATVLAGGNRATIIIKNGEIAYSNEASFQSENSFVSVERFVKGGPQSRTLSFTYHRCR